MCQKVEGRTSLVFSTYSPLKLETGGGVVLTKKGAHAPSLQKRAKFYLRNEY